MMVSGRIRPPGDKSVTHRALLFGAIASGQTRLERPLLADDTRAMAGALRKLGVHVPALRTHCPVLLDGVGRRGLVSPTRPLNCRNSGTAARLLIGVLAGSTATAVVTGDRSLRSRPMRRVTEPLASMGARFDEMHGDGLPLRVIGTSLRSTTCELAVASAQVKSAVLFAGLVAGVDVTVVEPMATRDHTERMARALGIPIETDGQRVTMHGVEAIRGFEMSVPGDPSSAAFLIGLALLADHGELTVTGMTTNPTRIGFLRVLERMGAAVVVEEQAAVLGEPIGDVTARPSELVGVEVAAQEIPSLIDEVPMLAVLASRATGESRFRGVRELRFKESNRLEGLARNLRAIGGRAAVEGDDLVVEGSDAAYRGVVETDGDHRIAMAFSVLGRQPSVRIQLTEDRSPSVSYPAFFEDLRGICDAG
jgi:3-phosphoshikimate 1-carboxyvinyltransferase